MSERKKLKMVSSTTVTSPVPVAPSAAPDPEVRAIAKRRQFNAAYKLSVLEEADRCSSPGAIGALLRREGLEKAPGIAETLDWASALVGLEIRSIDQDPTAVQASLICLLKTEADLKAMPLEDTARLIGKAA